MVLRYFDPSYQIRSSAANSEDSIFCDLFARHAVPPYKWPARPVSSSVICTNGSSTSPLNSAGHTKRLDPRAVGGARSSPRPANRSDSPNHTLAMITIAVFDTNPTTAIRFNPPQRPVPWVALPGVPVDPRHRNHGQRRAGGLRLRQ